MLAALPVAGFTADRRLSPIRSDPFTLGVASGDPAPDGAVIWTRLAPDPLAEDGFGGMPARPVDVEWEVAADERFARVEQRGTATATPEYRSQRARGAAGIAAGRTVLLPVPHRGLSVADRQDTHRAGARHPRDGADHVCGVVLAL